MVLNSFKWLVFSGVFKTEANGTSDHSASDNKWMKGKKTMGFS